MAKQQKAKADKSKAAAKSRPKAGRKPGTPDYPQSKRDEFRAHYLTSGISAQSAKAVDVPERTGWDWATELAKDPTFTEDRRVLRARYLEEHVAMRKRVAEKALERFEAEAPEHLGEGPPPIDRRPDFGKLVLDAEKNAHALAKFESPGEGDGGGKTEVHVHLAPVSTG